jgi:hypothetical protein
MKSFMNPNLKNSLFQTAILSVLHFDMPIKTSPGMSIRLFHLRKEKNVGEGS